MFENAKREHFRMFMRMQENFSGCWVLSYCIMSNHFHLLLEVPPMRVGGTTDAELLKRLATTNGKAVGGGMTEVVNDGGSHEFAETSHLSASKASLWWLPSGPLLRRLGAAGALGGSWASRFVGGLEGRGPGGCAAPPGLEPMGGQGYLILNC